MSNLFLEKKKSNTKDRFIGLLLVMIVCVCHFLLAIFLFFYNVTSPYQFQQGLDVHESLNMVNIELADAIPIKPVSNVAEKIMATEVAESVADLQKKQPKIEKIRPLEKVEKKQNNVKPKPKTAVKKAIPKKETKTGDINAHGKGHQVRHGDEQGKGVGKVTGAGLGAGYGSKLTGQCSDLSDDADDYGVVYLSVKIATDGKAKAISILTSSGIKRLDRQAIKIAQKHRYQPAKQDGKPIEGDVKFKMHFQCGNS